MQQLQKKTTIHAFSFLFALVKFFFLVKLCEVDTVHSTPIQLVIQFIELPFLGKYIIIAGDLYLFLFCFCRNVFDANDLYQLLSCIRVFSAFNLCCQFYERLKWHRPEFMCCLSNKQASENKKNRESRNAVQCPGFFSFIIFAFHTLMCTNIVLFYVVVFFSYKILCAVLHYQP